MLETYNSFMNIEKLQFHFRLNPDQESYRRVPVLNFELTTEMNRTVTSVASLIDSAILGLFNL